MSYVKKQQKSQKILAYNYSGQQANDIYLTALKKVQELANLNNKLVIIADQVSKINSPDINRPLPPIIYKFQTDINNSFNSLIENIQEYFIVLDNKLKEIGKFIGEKCQNKNETSYRQRENSNSRTSLQGLSYRIEVLQKQLKKTKNNEANLVKIVEDYSYREKQEQPTLMKNRLYESGVQQNNHSSMSQNSFRLFSMMDKNNQSMFQSRKQRPPSSKINIYKEIQHVSPKNDFRFNINKLCMPNLDDQSIRSVHFGKKSLKGQGQFNTEGSNKHYRMANMMRNLKQ